MPPKAGWYTPMLFVRHVGESIRFYEKLGFTLIDTEGHDDANPGWARMHCEGGAVMFLEAEEPMKPEQQATLFVLYTEDLPAFRAHLVAQGIECSEIQRPEYMPSGQIALRDPDGYALSVCHWSQAEHEPWLERIAEKARKWGRGA